MSLILIYSLSIDKPLYDYYRIIFELLMRRCCKSVYRGFSIKAETTVGFNIMMTTFT
jgi:hypothetical protein